MLTKIIIIIYFAGVLLIGLYSFFKIKNQNDYFVAGKKGNLLSVSGSLAATILGGSAVLGTIELSQNIGWAALWFLFSAAIGLFFLIPLSKKVKKYGNYTLPELLGLFYGKKAESIASAIIPIAWLGIVSAQIIAAAKILNGTGMLDYNVAVFAAGSVFIIYTLTGGQISILKTDFIQTILIISGLAATIIFTTKTPEFKSFEKFNFSELFNSSFSVLDLIILILTYSVTFVVGPDIYSRLFCAKNEKTASRSVLSVAILLIPASIFLTYIGVYSLQFENHGIVAFSQNLLPSWAFGLFIAALLSAVMSSADTTLLTSAIILNEFFSGNLNHKNSLKVTRTLVVILGITCMVISLYVTSIIDSLLFAVTFFSGAFIIPVLAALLKIKVNKKGVVYAILFGGITALSGKIIYEFYNELTGNLLIILSYFVNSFFLFTNRISAKIKT